MASVMITESAVVGAAAHLIISVVRNTAVDERCENDHQVETKWNVATHDTMVTVTCGERVEHAILTANLDRSTVDVIRELADKIASKFHPWAYFER